MSNNGNHVINNDFMVFGSINDAEQYLKKQYGYCTTYFVSNCTLSGPYIDCSCIDLHSSDDFDKITPTKKKNETS
jgi:hypothetical protein